MRRILIAFPAFLLLLPCLAGQVPHPAQKIPADSHIYLEWNDPGSSVAAFTGSAPLRAALQGGLLAEITGTPEFERLKEVWQVLGPVLKRRTSAGLRFGSSGPSVFVCAEHGGNLDLGALVKKLAAADAEIKPDERGKQRGISWVSLGKAGALGKDERFLYWGERPSSLREMSRVAREDSIQSGKRYKAALKEAGRFDLLTLIDVETLVDGKQLDDDMENFIEILLFKSLAEDLENTRFAYAWGRIGSEISLRARLVNKKQRPVSWDRAGRTWQPLPEVPGQSAHLRFDRKLPEFWARRLDIVPEAGRPELAEFAQTMNIFLSGFPFSDLMAKTGDGFDIVVREVVESEDAPELVLPQFALLLDVKFDKNERERFMVAFQTAIGVINADAGEERRQPLLQTSRRIGDVDILSAGFLDDPDSGRRKTEYNFTPSLAFIEGRLILSSSLELVCDIVRAATRPAAVPAPVRRGDRLEISGPATARMLRLNREAMIESRVLSEGEDEDEAGRFIDSLIESVGKIRSLRMNHIALPKSTVWDLVIRTAREGAAK